MSQPPSPPAPSLPKSRLRRLAIIVVIAVVIVAIFSYLLLSGVLKPGGGNSQATGGPYTVTFSDIWVDRYQFGTYVSRTYYINFTVRGPYTAFGYLVYDPDRQNIPSTDITGGYIYSDEMFDGVETIKNFNLNPGGLGQSAPKPGRYYFTIVVSNDGQRVEYEFRFDVPNFG